MDTDAHKHDKLNIRTDIYDRLHAHRRALARTQTRAHARLQQEEEEETSGDFWQC